MRLMFTLKPLICLCLYRANTGETLTPGGKGRKAGLRIVQLIDWGQTGSAVNCSRAPSERLPINRRRWIN